MAVVDVSGVRLVGLSFTWSLSLPLQFGN